MDAYKLGRRRFLLGAATVVGLALVGCGSNKAGQGARSGTVSPAPAEQQVLRLRIGGEPKTIDPHLTNFTTESTLTKTLFSGLFTYDENLKIVPNVAAEVPTVDNGGVSRDGLTYTIKLRKDARWSDGKALTANDFAYSLKRAMDPR
ncbi:MAG: ABC transporter substrate-binding protein, partial [Dehalococcoidia bacterium]|nr:ABC transporter substrate-binding protein [Dehalococcoidia bacterium]